MGNTLVAKIAAASLAVGALAVDKTNTAQNYSYISADKILDRAGKELAKVGIVILPSIISEETVKLEYTDNYGKTKTRFDSTVHFSMLITDGTGELTIPWRGRGNDFAVPDKSLYKAITSGHKYFLMKLLNIGVGNEDSEHEVEATQRVPETLATPATQPQRDELGDVIFSRSEAGATPPANVLSETQRKRLHAVGVSLYGQEEWDERRPQLVRAASKGAVTSSKELSPREASTLIEGMEKKLAEIAEMQVVA